MLRSLTFSLLAAFILATATSAFTQPSTPQEAERQAIFGGVDNVQVADNFSPGAVCFFAEKAFPILLGYAEGRQTPRIPMAAASYYGKGQVVIIGHSGLVGGEFFKSNLGLCENLVTWLADSDSTRKIPTVVKPKGDISVAVIGERATADFLRSIGFAAEFFPEWTDAAVSSQHNVLIINAERIREDQIGKILDFVQNGGGLMAAATGWGWQQLNPAGDLKTTFAGNRLVAPMGLVWTDQFAPRPRTGYQSAENASKFLHPKVALDAVLEKKAGAADWTQIVATLELALGSIPEKQAASFDGLQTLITRQVIPTKQNPIVAADQPLDRLAMLLQTQRYMNVQAQNRGVQVIGGLPEGLVIPKFEAAAEFPGSVPEDAERVSRTVSIDASIPDWHSTGLYAAPGEVITINTNGFVVHNGAFSIRIGALSDKLWHLERWERYPEISMTVPLRGEITKAVNPFGGHVYIVVPRGLSGTVEVQISGAVEAPYYVFGKTTDDEWKQSRQSPAPWAELASDRVILAVPSYLVRELDNPKEVMEFWNGVLDADAELAGWDLKRVRPERITADRQISAGWMHSGYPVMTPTQTERGLTDLAYLKERGDKWGFFHEFGHNHQSGDWTFNGSGEVTVNLFTLYIFEKMYDMPLSGTKLGEVKREMRPEVRRATKAKHIAAGAPFDQWKSDPFLALTMYAELIEEFGWKPFIDVFAEYRRLPANQRPRNDDEKRDQWMVRFSKQVGKNLGPFFDQWGVPVSQTAKDSIADLPVWLPE